MSQENEHSNLRIIIIDDTLAIHEDYRRVLGGTETDEDLARATAQVDFLERVVRDEDYATGLGIQRALRSGINDTFVFGRNELANQNFHRWVEQLVS